MVLWPMGWWAHARGASVPVATVTQTDACRFRRITASTRPREGKKEGWGEGAPARVAGTKCTWLKVTQGRAYPRRQIAECPLAAPRDRSHVSRRVFAFAARCKYLERKEGKGVKIFQVGLTQVLLFGLPREGRNHLHEPWTECRLRGEEKTRPAVLDARSGDKDSERGVKGGPHQGRGDKGSWRGLTKPRLPLRWSAPARGCDVRPPSGSQRRRVR